MLFHATEITCKHLELCLVVVRTVMMINYDDNEDINNKNDLCYHERLQNTILGKTKNETHWEMAHLNRQKLKK